MKLLSLSHDEIRKRLKGAGLSFNIGFSTVCLKSKFSNVADGVLQFYGHYPLAAPNDFVDFYVTLDSTFLRRWFRPQVNFSFDGFYPFKPLPQNQAFAMFEWGFNWVVAQHAHQYLIVHAAVVEKNNKALIFPGTPGSGKSTLCSGLVSKGWRLLSDEMALIEINTGLLQPIPRPISLKNQSIEIIREFAPKFVIGEPVEDTAKGTVAHVRAPENSVVSSKNKVYPFAVIFPKYKDSAETELTQISQGVGFMKLAENSFNYSVLGKSGFNTLGDVIDRCDCYEFNYSKLPDAISLFDSMVSE